MRWLVLGTTELTILCATALLDAGGELCGLVSIPRDARPENSVDIEGFARDRCVAYHEIEDINAPESIDLIRDCGADYIFSTWPRMLSKATLDVPKFFCIGTHPTDLPYNRGRHAIHWMISMGIPHTQISFFRMDEWVDTGDLLVQVPYEIDCSDMVGDVSAKMGEAAYEGTVKLYKRLLDYPGYKGVAQDHSKANYWRRRTPHDVTLDLRMSSDMILRTVRSFAPPYPAANLIFEDLVIKVASASVAQVTAQIEPEALRRIEPGKIIRVDGQTISVKAADAIIDLVCTSPIPERLARAKYIHPPTRYISKWPGLLDH